MTRAYVRKHHTGAFVGALTLGCTDCTGVGAADEAVITISGMGDTKADALHKAALIAERIASDPIMAAILPPQAAAAIAATKKLATAAKRGSRYFRRLWKRMKGPGVQRLAKALHDEAMKQEGHTDAEVGAFWSRVKKLAKKAARYTPAGLAVRAAAEAAKRSGLIKRKRKARPSAPPPQDPDNGQPMDEEPMDEEQQGEAPEAPDTDNAPGGVITFPQQDDADDDADDNDDADDDDGDAE